MQNVDDERNQSGRIVVEFPRIKLIKFEQNLDKCLKL